MPSKPICRAVRDSRSINHDDLPNIYARFYARRHALGALALLPTRSLATRFATCWVALIAVSGCSTPGPVGPTLASQPKLANGQPVSLESFAFDPTPTTSAIALPSPSSRAVPVTEGGTGQMIGGSPSAQTTGVSGSNVVLNLASVPLQQAAKTVLGDMVGVNYVVDPRVDGVITVQTTQPVSKAGALELFQAALAPIGAVLIQSRGIYRIAPADQAATGAVTTGNASADAIGGNGIRVVQLKYVAATEIARVLEPMVPKGAIVQADDARNVIALKGSPGEIASMLEFDLDLRCRRHAWHVVCRCARKDVSTREDGR